MSGPQGLLPEDQKTRATFGGRVLDVGRTAAGNTVDIEVIPGQNVRIIGLSDTLMKQLARNLFQEITFEVDTTRP